MKRFALLFAVLMLAGCAMNAGAMRLRDGRVIHDGMTRDQVVAALGKPDIEHKVPPWRMPGTTMMKYVKLPYQVGKRKTLIVYLRNGVVSKLNY